MTSVNHGEPYFLKADISKAGQSSASINDYIKMRVADNGKILPVQWYDQGCVMNVNGMIPFIEGAVGQWHTDDDDNIVMAPDADYRDWQGSAANTRDGGWADYILTDQMFTQKGIFYGKIGLMDGNGRRLTSIDIWFRVLGNDVMFGLTGKYYSDKIEKFIKQMQAKGDKAIDDIYERYKGKAQQSEDELDSINKNFETINAALKSVGLSTAALQNQIDSENLESVPNHNADIYLLKQDIVNRFGQLKHPTQVFDSLAQIQAKYPNGADGSMLTTDNGHIYVYNWNTNSWKDFGVFQAQGLPPEVSEGLAKTLKGYKILLNEIDPPYDNLDTLPPNEVVTYAYDNITSKVRNWPKNNGSRMATVITLSASGSTADGGAVQIIYFENGESLHRINWGNPAKYGDWRGLPLTAQMIQQHYDTITEPYNDLNKLYNNTLICYSYDLDKVANSPIEDPVGATGMVATIDSAIGYGTLQILIQVNGKTYWRFKWYDGSTWTQWEGNTKFRNVKKIYQADDIKKAEFADAHAIKNNKFVTYAVSNTAIESVSNRPSDDPFTILTFNGSDDPSEASGRVQLAVDASGQMYYTINWYNSWRPWNKVKIDSPDRTCLTSISLFRSIGIIGDSYASGELAIDKYADHYNMSWGQILARRNGATAINFSRGGQTTRGWLGDQERGLGLLKNTPAQDLYVLALGINDCDKLKENYIGNTADMGTDADTFYGNYGKIIQAIKDKAPNSKIVIGTLTQQGTTQSKFNTAIQNIAQHYGIPCLELNSDPFFTSNFYLTHLHGGHPTGPVYAGMSKAYERLIEDAMVMHLDYFENFENDRETDATSDMERIKKMSN